MINLTLSDIARITGGRLDHVGDPDIQVTGFVEFDSRKVAPGGLFAALPGEQVDGHDYAAQATEQGAVAVLASRPVGVPAIVVEPADDSEQAANDAVVGALSALARDVSAVLTSEHDLTVVGVTGSAGKTSTKDLLATVLSKAGSTVAPPGSFNNELGHPYTVLRCSPDTDYLVAEMSARGIGHIAHLASIAHPKVGLVLNVGTAHLGEFGSRENIARAKGELVEALPAAEDGGVAVLNDDDPFVAAMKRRTNARVVTFSAAAPTAPGAAYFATNITLDDVARASFTLHAPGGRTADVSLQVFGTHQVSNAVAAGAVGMEAGLSLEVVADALNNHRAAAAHRMDVSTRRDGVTVINDSYNANPESMRAGIAALAYTASARPGARSIAVLSEMSELGEDSVTAHQNLGEDLARFNIDHLVVVGSGNLCGVLTTAASDRGITTSTVADVDAAVGEVERILRTAGFENSGNDVVLVKASNSAGLWRVAEALLDGQGR